MAQDNERELIENQEKEQSEVIKAEPEAIKAARETGNSSLANGMKEYNALLENMRSSYEQMRQLLNKESMWLSEQMQHEDERRQADEQRKRDGDKKTLLKYPYGIKGDDIVSAAIQCAIGTAEGLAQDTKTIIQSFRKMQEERIRLQEEDRNKEQDATKRAERDNTGTRRYSPAMERYLAHLQNVNGQIDNRLKGTESHKASISIEREN